MWLAKHEIRLQQVLTETHKKNHPYTRFLSYQAKPGEGSWSAPGHVYLHGQVLRKWEILWKKALRHHKWRSNSVQMHEKVTFDNVDGAMQEHHTVNTINTWRTDYGWWVVVRADLSNCKIKNILSLFPCCVFGWAIPDSHSAFSFRMILSRISGMIGIY